MRPIAEILAEELGKKQEYVEDTKYQNRHLKFVQSIFVDVSKKLELEQENELITRLDEVLTYIFDGEG